MLVWRLSICGKTRCTTGVFSYSLTTTELKTVWSKDQPMSTHGDNCCCTSKRWMTTFFRTCGFRGCLSPSNPADFPSRGTLKELKFLEPLIMCKPKCPVLGLVLEAICWSWKGKMTVMPAVFQCRNDSIHKCLCQMRMTERCYAASTSEIDFPFDRSRRKRVPGWFQTQPFTCQLMQFWKTAK